MKVAERWYFGTIFVWHTVSHKVNMSPDLLENYVSYIWHSYSNIYVILGCLGNKCWWDHNGTIYQFEWPSKTLPKSALWCCQCLFGCLDCCGRIWLWCQCQVIMTQVLNMDIWKPKITAVFDWSWPNEVQNITIKLRATLMVKFQAKDRLVWDLYLERCANTDSLSLQIKNKVVKHTTPFCSTI